MRQDAVHMWAVSSYTWVWVGYSRKDVALDALKSNLEEGVEFCSGKNRSKNRPWWAQ